MRAIILKKNIFDESNEIVTFYTREQGKIRAVARAVKSAKSKLAHGLETLFFTEIDLTDSPKIPTITGVKPINTFKNLREDLQKVYAALFASELILKSTADQQPNAELFDSFLELLEHLDQVPHSSRSIQHLCADVFALRLLALTGYSLTFDICAICGKDISAGNIFFSSRKGGFICQSCSGKIADAQSISLSIYKFLKQLNGKGYSEIDQAEVSPKALHAFVDSFATHILERNLNASKYLGTLK